MVFTGRPSEGCENCRKAKKKCDQAIPCERCARLGKTCGGYRDLGELLFRDQNDTLARRASSTSEAGASISRLPSPKKAEIIRIFFFEQFVTDAHLTFMRDITLDEFLEAPISACALAAMSNLKMDSASREAARTFYVEALSATNAALRDAKRAKEDNTLVSVLLLGTFERLVWEGGSSIESWKHHISGAAQVLQLRGPAQTRTKIGAALFREIRSHLLVNAIQTEIEVPAYITQWTQALEYDRSQSPIDQLMVLVVRLASVKKAFKNSDHPDQVLAETAAHLEQEMIDWSEKTLEKDSSCSFNSVEDANSPHSWNGTRHEYATPQAHRYWNLWRTIRIMLSRLQEAIWRRSWPVLAPPTGEMNPEHYKLIRTRMTDDICVAAAYAFSNDASADLTNGAVSNGYLLVLPLTSAGTCILEGLAPDVLSPGGSRMIYVGEEYHLDAISPASLQLAWIIRRLDYINDMVGMRWAAAMSEFLKGGQRVHYNLGRSVVEDL